MRVVPWTCRSDAADVPGKLSAGEWCINCHKNPQDYVRRSLVIAGGGQPAIVHALAHAMNNTLGNVGATVVYTRAVEAQPIDQRAALQTLVNDMNAGVLDPLRTL